MGLFKDALSTNNNEGNLVCINVSKEMTNSPDTPSRFDKQDVLRSRADPIIDDIK